MHLHYPKLFNIYELYKIILNFNGSHSPWQTYCYSFKDLHIVCEFVWVWKMNSCTDSCRVLLGPPPPPPPPPPPSSSPCMRPCAQTHTHTHTYMVCPMGMLERGAHSDSNVSISPTGVPCRHATTSEWGGPASISHTYILYFCPGHPPRHEFQDDNFNEVYRVRWSQCYCFLGWGTSSTWLWGKEPIFF